MTLRRNYLWLCIRMALDNPYVMANWPKAGK